MIALAVDQHERLIGRQPAQGGGADKGLAIGGGQALDVERREQLRQRVVQVARHARADQRLGQHIDRRQRIELRPTAFARAGDDHVVAGRGIGGGLALFGAILAGWRGLGPGDGREQDVQRCNSAGGREFHDEAFPLGRSLGTREPGP